MGRGNLNLSQLNLYFLVVVMLALIILEYDVVSKMCASEQTVDFLTARMWDKRNEPSSRTSSHSADNCRVIETQKDPWKNAYDIRLACFVITMPSRCGNVTKRFQRLGLPCTMVKAVVYDEIDDPEVVLKEKKLRNTQIAAYHSHRKALRRFLDAAAASASFITHALILEDDIDMPADIKSYTLRRLELLNTIDPLWNMLYLFYTYERRPFEDEAVIPGSDIYKATSPRAAAAYIVTERTAESLLRMSTTLRQPIDELYANLINKNIIRAYMTYPSRLTHIRSFSTILLNQISPQRRFRPELYSCCCKYVDIENVNSPNDVCISKESCKWNEFDLNCMHVFSINWRESNCRASCGKASMEMCGEQRHLGTDSQYVRKNEEEPGNYTGGCSENLCFKAKSCNPVGLPAHSGVPITRGTGGVNWHMKDYEWYEFNGFFWHDSKARGTLGFSFQAKNNVLLHKRKTAYKNKLEPNWSVLPGSGRFNMKYVDEPDKLNSLKRDKRDIWNPEATEAYYQFPVINRNQMNFSNYIGDNCSIILSHRHYTLKGMLNKKDFYGEFWKRDGGNKIQDRGRFHVKRVEWRPES